ncbi:FAD:protein FMN transferase [bacterium]|nr:FAD:protein FMN transferase [bacterium]
MRVSLRFLTSAAAILLLSFTAATAADQPLKASLSAMGGIPINLSAWGLDQAAFDLAVTEISARIEELEAMISTYRPDSEVSRLNRGETLESTPADLSFLVFVASWISGETAGTFDITVEPLVLLWRQCRQEQRLPTAEEYEAALANVGHQLVNVKLDGSITFDQPGVKLDFGGIAKGYFADEAVTLLREAGATRCLAEVGGDITTWQADPAAGEPFKVGIKHPYGGDELYGIISVPTGAVVTSGNYERFYEINGHRYCHIFDPRTGHPVENMLSVTVTTKGGIEADAYATAIFVMGLEVGRSFVERNEQIEAVLIGLGADGKVVEYISPGLVDRVELNPNR